MPRAPRDPNAPRKSRTTTPKPAATYFVEGAEPGTLGAKYTDLHAAYLESVKSGFKPIATVVWSKPSITADMKAVLQPITE